MSMQHSIGDQSAPRDEGFEVFDLNITVGPALGGGSELLPWLSASSRLGHLHGIPRHDPRIPPLADLLDSVYDFVDAVRFSERRVLADLREALGRLVFGEPAIMELFQATRGVAAEHGRELLVRILASPHLAALPWELLPDPGKTSPDGDLSYLALAPDANVVRLARGRTYPIRTTRLDPPLNLLVVLSSPAARGPRDESLAFDIFEEKRNLLAELRPLVDSGLLCVDVEDQPTLQNLRRRIGAQRRGYHLFHYLGHAKADQLVLEDEFGRSDDQSGARFTEVLRLCPDLRLAVFAGCETARAPGDPLTIDTSTAERWRCMLSLADRCVQDSCPAVVGMQAVLSFRTERLFTRFFYQGIASGYSITGAMRLARGATRSDRHVGGDCLDWSVPVLFVGGSEPTPLLDRTAKGVPPQRFRRHVLRLGFQQSQSRFFARDVALRQAVDVLSGRTPERVLVVTGPPAVGKTMLIDRALEELNGTATILYVALEQLVPEFQKQPGWLDALAAMEVDAPLEKLCHRIAELLKQEDGRSHESEAGQTASDWWLRLIETLSEGGEMASSLGDRPSRRVVIVIDNVELLNEEKRLAEQAGELWLDSHIRAMRSALDAEALRTLIDQFLQQVGRFGFPTPNSPPNSLVRALAELDERLEGQSSAARGAAVAEARVWLQHFDTRLEASETGTASRPGFAQEKLYLALCAAVRRLAQVRHVLDDALRKIGDRRSDVRLAVLAERLPAHFLALGSDRCFVMRLGPLTWSETQRWIRRNLPGLVGYGDAYLEQIWPRLGTDLDKWEEFERRVLEAGPGAPVRPIVDELAPRREGSDNPFPGRRERGERPLRVSVAAAQLRGDLGDLAFALTRMAGANGVGGRVVVGEGDSRGALAVLVSPKGDDHAASQESNGGPGFPGEPERDDIALFDLVDLLGMPEVRSGVGDQEVFGAVLLIGTAAASLEMKGVKANSSERGNAVAIEVGRFDRSGQLSRVIQLGPPAEEGLKPPLDWFTPTQSSAGEVCSDSTLQPVGTQDVKDLARRDSKDAAAIHALAAAVLVWSILPSLTPDQLRWFLLDVSHPGERRSQSERSWLLMVEDAVKAARREVVLKNLREGACSLQALVAITGLDVRHVIESVDTLLSSRQIRRLTRGRFERYVSNAAE